MFVSFILTNTYFINEKGLFRSVILDDDDKISKNIIYMRTLELDFKNCNMAPSLKFYGLKEDKIEYERYFYPRPK